jgi:hypothetical protein
MSVLTIDVGGANEMSVDCQRAGHTTPRRVGQKQSPGSGSELPYQIRAEFMVVPVVLTRLPNATVAILRDLFSLGRQVNCAGDVFVNGGGTAKWSGKITDELAVTADETTVSMTLFECGAASDYTPASTLFLLTSVDSPDSSDPTVYVSTPDGSYPSDTSTAFDLLAGTTVTTGGSLNPTTPDRSFLSVELNAGVVTGTPYVQMETAMTGIYSGTSVWATMDVMAKIYQVRPDGMGGFTIIAGPFSTNYGGVSVGGGVIRLDASSAVVLALATHDRMLVELYPRLALQPATADNTQRQTVWQGAVPGPRSNPVLGVGGVITSYP